VTKIATPISHLFKDKAHAERIIAHSGCLECRDDSLDSVFPGQELFHCDIQPIHRLQKKEFDHLKRIKSIKPKLRLITFHIASCCDKPVLKNMIFNAGGTVYTEKEMLNNASENIAKIRNIFGEDIGIAIENNNYYPTEAYEYVTEPEFISKLVNENDIGLLFDIAHARVASYNKKTAYETYRDALPLSRVKQLHISAYGVNKNDGIAYDMHEYPKDEDFSEAAYLLKCFDIGYLGVEYYKDTENLIKSLKEARKLI